MAPQDHGESVENGIEPLLVRKYLQKVISSGTFSNGAKLSNLLRFVVERTLEGRAADIKEYSIGVDALGRDIHFDPRTDPAVRVQFRRLRAKLDRYYSDEGADDAIQIALPKGRYIPSFSRRVRPPAQSAPGEPESKVSVAITPFASLSSLAEDIYFAEGLTEELIHYLMRATGLRVIAMRAPASARSPKETSSAKADFIFTGSVRRSGTKIRVSAQLLRLLDSSYFWSDMFERELQDIFIIQQEISRAITRALSVTPPGQRRTPTHSKPAHDLVLKAVHYRRTRRRADLSRCIELYKAAVEIDPRYAAAYLGIAEAHVQQAFYADARPADVMPAAEQAARQALTLDVSLVEAWATLGAVAGLYHRNSADATSYFDRARDLVPNYHLAWEWRAVACEVNVGNLAQARQYMETARDLDPLSPGIVSLLAYIHLISGDLETARREAQQAIELHPHAYLPHWVLGLIQEQGDDFRRAASSLELACQLSDSTGFVTASLAHNLTQYDAQRARAMLSRLTSSAKAGYVPSLDLALVHLGLGEIEQSRKYLSAANEERSPWLPFFKVDPRTRLLWSTSDQAGQT